MSIDFMIKEIHVLNVMNAEKMDLILKSSSEK